MKGHAPTHEQREEPNCLGSWGQHKIFVTSQRIVVFSNEHGGAHGEREATGTTGPIRKRERGSENGYGGPSLYTGITRSTLDTIAFKYRSLKLHE